MENAAASLDAWSEPPGLRYAVVGTGHRSEMYIEALATIFRERAALVGLVDPNPVRAAYYNTCLNRHGLADVPVRHPDDLEGVISELEVDRVIITSRDDTHAELIERSLRAGARVIVEKPLTMSVDGANRIMAAVDETGLDVVVAFNYRYSPRNTAVKSLLASRAIGTPTSIHFEWLLDTAHGADYFRRWHRDKIHSGGLLVHKSAHHFDLVNWWLNDSPTRVYVAGGLRFYGDENAGARGVTTLSTRGSVAAAASDPFALDLRRDDRLRALYLDAEMIDGYIRDQSPFAPGITIEDNLSAVVSYTRGTSMSYSLNAHSPWEGYRVAVNGTEGRLELDVVERSAIVPDIHGRIPVDPSAVDVDDTDDEVRPMTNRLVLQRQWERARVVPLAEGEGAHGGGDQRLLDDLFLGAGDDPLHHTAGLGEGLAAIAIGLAGNVSLDTGRSVEIDDLGFLHDFPLE